MMNEETQVEINALRLACDEQTKAYNELRTEMEGLEKERDFYFDKLRDIEILLQDVEDNGTGNELTASIFKILYATADGFEAVVETENPETEANGHTEMNGEMLNGEMPNSEAEKLAGLDDMEGEETF
jgi:RP/EB family microtubule-associated protein